MSEHASTSHAELSGYRIVRVLAPDRTFLAEAVGGRRVVIKVLPEGCVSRGRLEPSIYERLARVRELPEKSVANLHGVEREGEAIYLVWDYVAGRTLDDPATVAALTDRQCLDLARDLTLAVESLHGSGLVHGALKPGNVVLDELGEVRLTHISPLLYTEVEQDAQALVKLLRSLVELRQAPDGPLGRMLDEARMQGLSVRQLAARLSGLNSTSPSPQVRRSGKATEARIRRRSVLAAVTLLILAIVAAGAIAWYARTQQAEPVPLEELPNVELDGG